MVSEENHQLLELTTPISHVVAILDAAFPDSAAEFHEKYDAWKSKPCSNILSSKYVVIAQEISAF